MTKYWKKEILFLICTDMLAFGAAFYLAFWLRLESGLLYYGAEVDVAAYRWVFLLSLPLVWMLFYCCRLYDMEEIFYGTIEYVQVIKVMTFAVLAVIVVSFIVHSQPLSRSWLLLFWIFGIFFIGLARFMIRRMIRPLFRLGRRSEPVLFVGASEEAKSIAQTLNETGRFDIVGFLDDFSSIGEKVSGDKIIIGSPQDYERIAREEGVSKLILVPGAVSWETYREISFEATKWNGMDILIAPHLGGIFSGNLIVSYIGYIPMYRFRPGYTSGLDKVVKVSIDLFLGLIIFLLSIPVLLIFSVALFMEKGRPIFEGHEALGLHGRPFRTYKFNTGLGANHRCFQTANETGAALSVYEKLSVPRLLFATGLDKLPQIINVLCGKMSLVGPRIVFESEVADYGIWLQNVLAVNPGMTGPWALGDHDLQQEIASTLSYIHTWTPWKDLQILCITLFYLLHKRLIAGSAKGGEG